MKLTEYNAAEEMHGKSDDGWIVVPPGYPDFKTTFGPFSRKDAIAFMQRRYCGDYAYNAFDYPNWFTK